MSKLSSKKKAGEDHRSPKAIGLTGGIGAGKTIVAQIFEALGVPVYYADDEAKKLMATDPGLIEAIQSLFGKEAYRDGNLNRAHIASRAFDDPDLLKKLNELVHPRTIRHADEWRIRQNTPYIIKEAALIFESGAHKKLDAVIGVTAPLELRISRVMLRDRVTREEVMKRIQRQMDEEEKINRCDFVIVNDEQELLIPRVLEIHKQLLT